MRVPFSALPVSPLPFLASYWQGLGGYRRPLIGAWLIGPRQRLPYDAVVDSGAVYSLFPMSGAHHVGLDPRTFQFGPLMTAGGAIRAGFPLSVSARPNLLLTDYLTEYFVLPRPLLGFSDQIASAI